MQSNGIHGSCVIHLRTEKRGLTRVLIVDDDRSMCDLISEALTTSERRVVFKTSADEALQALKEEDFDVVVTDLSMAGMTGTDLCRRLVDSYPDVPCVVMTGFGSLETAVEAIRAGAYDFITKPLEMTGLALIIERAAKHRMLNNEVRRLRKALAGTRPLETMLGESAAMNDVVKIINQVADSEATILVSGESGTGKELVARALHQQSRRSQGPFVAINCAAIPEPVLESELFGHVKGAFTDAHASRAGLFVDANQGTVFLDEIGEMPVGMQVKLLRALQERTVRPVGASVEVPFDVRIIAATNRDLETLVAEKIFREDLYYRINVVRIHVPPLRSRGNDVLLLAQAFVDRYAAQNGKGVKGISAPTAERLLTYDWPGNVRELQNCIERAVALTIYDQISVDDLPEKISAYRPTRLILDTQNPDELPPMEEVERRYIRKVLESVGGNKTMAASVLGFDRRTLHRKLQRPGMMGDGEPEGNAVSSGPESCKQ
ncbi:MAG TPA: sigma-54 dependent transcriptional regulator [Myxococcaceae bacterium]|nr:sigma-54 dependent transcriptional regulator [Myxococcaceae bacterium]